MSPSSNNFKTLSTIHPTGWNTWDVHHLNAVCHLPSTLEVLFSLRNAKSQQVRDHFDWRTGMHRLGPHATDGSYCEVELKWDNDVVKFEYASQVDRLVCRISPVPPTTVDTLILQVRCLGAWDNPVQIIRQPTGLQADCNGTSWMLLSPNPLAPMADQTVFEYRLDHPILVQVVPNDGTSPTALRHDLDSFINQQRTACLTTSVRSSGWLAGAADGLTRAISWNTIWEPRKGRICTPVSRDWCKGHFFGSYVLFDWDTFFCATMANLEDPVLASANIDAILQEVTPRGFVPNFGCEHGASEDRSQPPVGAYCVLKLYRAHSLANSITARALLETTFPALVRWHEWWYPNRDGNGDGLLEWGSDPLPGLNDWQCDNMQAAMYESGLDNSPMYDDTRFNPQTHTMELADVGLNALYAMDAWSLGEIARELELPDMAERFTSEYQRLANLINQELWDETAGIYKNKHWDGHLSPHLSPTNFYPLIAGIASPERAQRMVHGHLLNESEFWGRFVIPSTARNDPGFGGNNYWRGRIWGPMNFLVSEGLRRYGFDTVVHDFARRSLDLFNCEWLAESHVHENYSTDNGEGDDVPNSDPVYTWGALLAFIAIQELVDVETWGSWRFGNHSVDPAVIKGIKTIEGNLDVSTGPEGLKVDLNHELLIHSEPVAVVSNFSLYPTGVSFDVRAEPSTRKLALTIGHLPSNHPIKVDVNGRIQALTANSAGQIRITNTAPVKVKINWI